MEDVGLSIVDPGATGVPRFLRSFLLSLPRSLRTIGIRFQDRWETVFSVHQEEWQALDKMLSEEFPALSHVEILWDTEERHTVDSDSDSNESEEERRSFTGPPNHEQVMDHLIMLDEMCILEDVLPSLYKRGILWCGDSGSAITEVVLVAKANSPASYAWDPCFHESIYFGDY